MKCNHVFQNGTDSEVTIDQDSLSLHNVNYMLDVLLQKKQQLEAVRNCLIL